MNDFFCLWLQNSYHLVERLTERVDELVDQRGNGTSEAINLNLNQKRKSKKKKKKKQASRLTSFKFEIIQ